MIPSVATRKMGSLRLATTSSQGGDGGAGRAEARRGRLFALVVTDRVPGNPNTPVEGGKRAPGGSAKQIRVPAPDQRCGTAAIGREDVAADDHDRDAASLAHQQPRGGGKLVGLGDDRVV